MKKSSHNNQNRIEALKNELKDHKHNFGDNHFVIVETLKSLILTYLHVIDNY